MTDPNADIQVPESQLTPETVAYHRLKDRGISAGEGEASYRWSIDFTAMTDAVKLVRNHLSKPIYNDNDDVTPSTQA